MPTISVDITFADAPLNQYAKLGTDYKIRCEVRGNPQPSVDWGRNDVSLTSNERYIIDSSGLLIKNVRESDDGVYTCSALVLETGNMQYRNIKVGRFVVCKKGFVEYVFFYSSRFWYLPKYNQWKR